MEKEKKRRESKIYKFVKIALVFAALIAAAGMYKSVPLKSRAVVVGLGIDFAGGGYEITAEVISPSKSNPGSSAGGSSTKLASGKGATVAMALQDLYKTTGKLPSLGQTSILVLGEGMGDTDVRDTLSLFLRSDAFNDGVTVSTCKGTAKELFQSVPSIDNTVSFALKRIITSSASNTGTPTNSVAGFLENQTHGSLSSFVCRIETEAGEEQSEEAGSGGEKEKLFDCTKLDVFKEGKRIAEVGREETKGFVLLKEKDGCSLFVVDGSNGEKLEGKLTAKISSKKINAKYGIKNGVPTADFEISVRIKQAYTDSSGFVMDFLPVYQRHSGLEGAVEAQILDAVQKGVLKSVELGCDYFDFYGEFYAANGRKWKDFADGNPDYLSKIQFGFKVNVEEK